MALFVAAILAGIAIIIYMAKFEMDDIKESFAYGNAVDRICGILDVFVFAETIVFIAVFAYVFVMSMMM